jgi:hypothetical protein
MEGAKHSNLEMWDRLLLLVIARPLDGWQTEFNEIVRCEFERLAVPTVKTERDE